ncbi:MAG TPA: hypothetical protein VHO24_18150 [Opitutaceae bacterium]|nr:hypothetical protein [Opitutaceae bacterium]
MQKFYSGPDRRLTSRRSAELDFQIIQDAFAKHLHALGYASLTIGCINGGYKKSSVWVCQHGRRLADVGFDDVVTLLARLARGGSHAGKMNRAALHCWLRFGGLKLESTTRQVAGPLATLA